MSVPGSAPVAHAPGPLKRVPKWAWVASGGVIVGVAVMRWRSNKGSTAPSGEDTATGDMGQAGQSFPGNVTSPAQAGDAGYSGGGSSGSGVDIPTLIDSLGNFLAVNQPHDDTADVVTAILGNLPGYAGGGGPPSSGGGGAAPAPDNYAPVPPAPEPPAPPAPPPPPPPPPPPVAVSSGPQCGGSFPFASSRGCYRVEVDPKGHAKGRWHFYSNGDAVRVG